MDGDCRIDVTGLIRETINVLERSSLKRCHLPFSLILNYKFNNLLFAFIVYIETCYFSQKSSSIFLSNWDQLSTQRVDFSRSLFSRKTKKKKFQDLPRTVSCIKIKVWSKRKRATAATATAAAASKPFNTLESSRWDSIRTFARGSIRLKERRRRERVVDDGSYRFRDEARTRKFWNRFGFN